MPFYLKPHSPFIFERGSEVEPERPIFALLLPRPLLATINRNPAAKTRNGPARVSKRKLSSIYRQEG